jgi:hypothetical protein
VRTVKKQDVEDGRSHQVNCRIEIGRTHKHAHATVQFSCVDDTAGLSAV